MDEPLFDAICALCYAAEAEGFDAVAEGLELVLDVYLKERDVLLGLNVVFISRRTREAQQVEAFRRALKDEPLPFSCSYSWFPLAAVS